MPHSGRGHGLGLPGRQAGYMPDQCLSMTRRELGWWPDFASSFSAAVSSGCLGPKMSSSQATAGSLGHSENLVAVW